MSLGFCFKFKKGESPQIKTSFICVLRQRFMYTKWHYHLRESSISYIHAIHLCGECYSCIYWKRSVIMVCSRRGVTLNTHWRNLSAYFHIKYSCVFTSGNREDFKCVIENRWYSWLYAMMGHTFIKINIHCTNSLTKTHIDLCGLSAFFSHCCVTGRARAADLWHVLCHTETLSNEDRCDRTLDQMEIYKNDEGWHQQNQMCEVIFGLYRKQHRMSLRFLPPLSSVIHNICQPSSAVFPTLEEFLSTPQSSLPKVKRHFESF